MANFARSGGGGFTPRSGMGHTGRILGGLVNSIGTPTSPQLFSPSSPYSPETMVPTELVPWDDDPLGLTQQQNGMPFAAATGASTRSSTHDLFEEGRLRDMLVQKRITREGLSWKALPFRVQSEVDAVREMYQQAAAEGHTQAAYNLGLMYYLGKGVAKDLSRAVGLLQAAANAGHTEATFLMSHSEAQFNLALLYLTGMAGGGLGGVGSVPKDVSRGVALLERAVDQGHVEAMYRLGRMLFVGDEVARDHTRAITLLQRAGELGKSEALLLVKHSTSQFQLGRMFEDGGEVGGQVVPAAGSPRGAGVVVRSGGVSVPQSYTKAVGCYRRAAAEGHAEAQYRLGLLYQEGLGTSDRQRNPRAAVQCFQRAAHQGFAEAQHHLGLLFYHGQGVPRDLVRARGFWRRAAAQGHADAQFSLGFVYFNAEGVARNLSRAADLYQQAAEQGHGKAATTLAYMFYHGDGVPRDYWRAADLARRGAAQDHADAMFLLGVMNENGDGVVRSESSAVGWYRRASRLGHSEAEARLGIVTATLHSQTGPLVGQRVIVHGLGTSKSSSSPHSPPSSAATLLNGATGLVLGYDASTGYCTVELSDGRTTKFRPENLASPYM